MPKKRVTKIDPKKELSPYLNHQSNQHKNNKKEAKVSASLANLHAERKISLVRRLGLIITISLLFIIGLGYYISPLADVGSVQVEGVADLPPEQVVENSGIKASDKVFDYLFHQKNLGHRLGDKYHEIQNVGVKLNHFNRLVLKVNEYPTIGYIKEGSNYRKILADGKVGSRSLPWAKVDQDKPFFVGYNHMVSLEKDLELFDSFPQDFKNKVKLLSGNTRRGSQIILVMKDGNVVIGNISTLNDKLKYYNEIKSKADKNSLIDLEVGAFSRPLTSSEKKAYGIS